MRIVAVGSVYFEINAKLQTKEFHENIEETIESFENTIGGSIAYFSITAQELGIQTILIAKVGIDTRAETLESICKRHHITTKFIKDKSVSTNTAINISNQLGNMIMGIDKTASQALTAKELDTEISEIKIVDILYISALLKSPHLIDYWNAKIPQLRKSGTQVVLDYGRSSNTLSNELLAKLKTFIATHVDIFLPSREDRFLELMDTTSEAEALTKSEEIFPNTLTILKQDKDGASYCQNGKVQNIKTVTIDSANIVGAGDIFNAGFINSYFKDKNNLKDSVSRANQLAYNHILNQQS